MLVSDIPSSSFVDIEISTESLIHGETLITCKYFPVLFFRVVISSLNKIFMFFPSF